MKVTLKTISQELGISITTVSRALKDGAEVKKATKDLVVATAMKLGYAANIQGVSLRTGINYNVAMIMPLYGQNEIDKNIGKLNFINGIVSSLNTSPFYLTIVPVLQTEDPLEKVKFVCESDLAGTIILVNTTIQDKCVAYLHNRQFPFVSFGQTEMGLNHAYVDLDNYDIGYKAAKYLFDNGCKDIRFFVNGLKTTSNSHRFYGARHAAMEYGIPFETNQLIEGNSNAEESNQAAFDLFTKEKPDGVFFSSELGALNGIKGMQRVNPKLLDDVKIISCEESFLHAVLSNKYALIQIDLDEVGRKIGEFAMNLHNCDDMSGFQHVFKANFIERAL